MELGNFNGKTMKEIRSGKTWRETGERIWEDIEKAFESTGKQHRGTGQ